MMGENDLWFDGTVTVTQTPYPVPQSRDFYDRTRRASVTSAYEVTGRLLATPQGVWCQRHPDAPSHSAPYGTFFPWHRIETLWAVTEADMDRAFLGMMDL